MVTKPLVLPETYTGEGEWSQRICHFENVAIVNGWDDNKKLLRLVKGQTDWTGAERLSDTASASYKEAKKAQQRFKLASSKGLYKAEFQTRRKKKAEGWAEFVEDLKIIVDKAYPDLQDEAREQMALTHYLAQIENLQVEGGSFPSEVIVVDSLMTEGVLGVDFLKTHRCNIDLERTTDPGPMGSSQLLF